jgi:hypothetical protein
MHRTYHKNIQILSKVIFYSFSDFGVYIGYNRHMGILDNFENYLELEPTEQPENDGLALKIFKEECCDNCNCKN